MSAFKTKLVVEFSEDQRTALLFLPLSFHSDLLGREIIVPAGFVTDFASTRRWMWIFYPPTGLYGEPAVVHDYLYRHNGLTRKVADQVFLEAMEVKGVRWTQRHLFYQSVRMFGWIPWNEYRKNES